VEKPGGGAKDLLYVSIRPGTRVLPQQKFFVCFLYPALLVYVAGRCQALCFSFGAPFPSPAAGLQPACALISARLSPAAAEMSALCDGRCNYVKGAVFWDVTPEEDFQNYHRIPCSALHSITPPGPTNLRSAHVFHQGACVVSWWAEATAAGRRSTEARPFERR
jgi:hypothetical protein